MSRMAELISMNGENTPPGRSRMAFSSSSAGGISGVREVDHNTDPIEQMAPKKKDPKTQYGMPERPSSVVVSPLIQRWKKKSERFARVMPRPVKKLCVRKPMARWDGGSLSAMKARYGSIAVLFPASRIHSRPTAIQSALLKGKAKRARLHMIAPIRK